MTKKRRKKSSPKISSVILQVAALLILAAIGYFLDPDVVPVGTNAHPAGEVSVHFADVGQGDAILISTPKQNILIDCGRAYDVQNLLNYLRDAGVEKIDLLIGTHPDSDHIGGMAAVLDLYTPERIMLPKVSDELAPTTRTYIELLEKIDEKNLKIRPPKPGEIYDTGAGTLEFYPEFADAKSLNDLSIVCRFVYGDTSFLFTGDIEKNAEKFLSENFDLSADVLKVGHHGSKTSTSEVFLNAVNPEIAVISAGNGNSYGHPAPEITGRLYEYGAKIYRTDLAGAIVMTTDGKTLRVSAEHGTAARTAA